MERFFSLIAVSVALILFVIIFKTFNKRAKRYKDAQEKQIHNNSTELEVLKESNDFAQRLEVLHRDLENNELEQGKAHREIERLQQFLETDRDAQQAIENQERWLEELEMSRNQVEHEIKGLREQR